MTGRVQWKKFAFFDKDTVNENIAGTLDAQLTCACADNGLLLFGDSSGFISLSDRNLHLSWKHKAFRGPVKGVAYVENQRRQYVIAAGDEYVPPSGSANALGGSVDVGRNSEMSEGTAASVITASSPSRFAVKIFAANDMSRPLQAFLVTQSCVQGHVLTAFSVNNDCTQIAVGFSNGALILYGGHFLKDHSLGSRLPPAPTVLFPSHHAPMAALHFCELYMLPAAKTGGSSLRQLRLFAVLDTETASTGRGSMMSSLDRSSMGSEAYASAQQAVAMGGIFVFDTSMAEETTNASSGQPQAITLPRLGVPRMLDERGASAECSSLMEETAELVIGREEGVFLYSVDDRGGAAGFEGEKQCVTAVGRYILVGSMDVKTRRVLVTIYDLRNKFISMSHLLAPGDNIRMVLHDGGVAYVVTTSGTLIRFREKDTLSKVDVLLKKSLHALAIALAAEEQAPVAEVMKLYKHYGDHLFKRGDYEAAVVQYAHTIGFIPASYVIRRFLDSQRIGHLTSYLETLHTKGFASKDLTTLLLTCYTKTRDVDRLDAFIAQGDTFNDQQDDDGQSKGPNGGTMLLSGDMGAHKFDISAAVATLRHAGYTRHAMKLALRYGDHDGYLSMLLYPTDSEGNDQSASSDEVANSKTAVEANAGEAAFAHLIGIVDDVVGCVKKDVENSYKYTTTASSIAAHYMTRKLSNGSTMRVTETTNEKMDALLALIKRHGRRILYLQPDALTGLLIMLYTGVPLGVMNETRTPAPAGDVETADTVTASAIDLRILLNTIVNSISANRKAQETNQNNGTGVTNTIQISSYSDALYTVEDLVSVFIDDFGIDHGCANTDVHRPEHWQQKYLMAFLEGSVIALSPNLAKGNNCGNTIVNMKGGRRPKLSSHMTGLLIELCLEQYDKLKNSSVASSTAKVNGIPLMSEAQRKIAIAQLEVKVMNMLDGTVAADYDIGHAMLLVHSFNFTPGMLYLLEKSQSVDVILGQLRESKDYNGIFRIMRREGSQNPDLMLQQLEYFVLDTVELQQQRQLKQQQKSGKKLNSPNATLQQHQDSDDEYQSSHGASSRTSENSESSSSEEESESENDVFDHVETMLDIMEPDIVYAGSIASGDHHHGHISISQVLKVLALNPSLPLRIPLDLVKNALRGASNGLSELQKDTYKMRLTVEALLTKPNPATTQKKVAFAAGKVKSGGANPFGDSESDEEGATGVMMGYNDGDDAGDEDYERIVLQAERTRERQHWEGIKKSQLEKANDHEGFYAELDASANGYATVASFFCKKPIIS